MWTGHLDPRSRCAVLGGDLSGTQFGCLSTSCSGLGTHTGLLQKRHYGRTVRDLEEWRPCQGNKAGLEAALSQSQTRNSSCPVGMKTLGYHVRPQKD